jgi:nicotinic acid mononucleotide adenylyltransferase
VERDTVTEKVDNSIEILNLVKMIHNSPQKIVLAVTGGGTEAIGELLRHGKGSDTILEAIVPYSKEALIDFIGKEPIRYASPDTAKDIAMSAYRRALYLNAKQESTSHEILIGIGVTSKLTNVENEREGRKHEIHFAYQSYYKTGTSSMYLKSSTTREEQEHITSDFIIEKVGRICVPDKKIELVSLNDTLVEEIVDKEAEAERSVADLLLKTLENINSNKNCEPLKVDMGICDVKRKVILSGSFNPCHKNHVEMARIAANKYKEKICFEISLANVDKPPIDFISLKDRVNSILEHRDEIFMGNIYITNSPLFADKAILFPDSVFLIGADTLNRLFNDKYYRYGEDRKSLLNHFQKYNVRFLVFQRKNSEISDDMNIPDICDIVSMDMYTDDGTSSTTIREHNPGKII